MTSQSTHDPFEITQLRDRLDRLEEENRALRQRLDNAPPPPGRLSRRALLGGGAALGTALAAGSPSSAAAAPLYLEIDKPDNAGTNPTGIRGPIVPAGGGAPDIFTQAFAAWNQHASAGTGITTNGPSFGLFAVSQGQGILARSEGGGVGVQGWVDGDVGLDPPTSTSSGVWGQSSYAAAPAFLADAEIALRTLPRPGGMPVSDDARQGDLSIRTDVVNGSTWWVCVQEAEGGDPARFVRIVAPGSAGALDVLPAPIRVYDSRLGTTPATGPKSPLVGVGERVVSCVANTAGAVPTDATAVMVNLTIVAPSAAGWAAMYADGATWGGTSNVNFAAGQTIANAATVACGPDAAIRVRNGQAPVSFDFIVDVTGFYR